MKVHLSTHSQRLVARHLARGAGAVGLACSCPEGLLVSSRALSSGRGTLCGVGCRCCSRQDNNTHRRMRRSGSVCSQPVCCWWCSERCMHAAQAALQGSRTVLSLCRGVWLLPHHITVLGDGWVGNVEGGVRQRRSIDRAGGAELQQSNGGEWSVVMRLAGDYAWLFCDAVSPAMLQQQLLTRPQQARVSCGSGQPQTLGGVPDCAHQHATDR
jgi:hypothetical protein